MALLDRSEQHHEQCVEVVRSLGAPLITCEGVVAESCYLLRELTLDGDFRVYRWGRNRPFDLLLSM